MGIYRILQPDELMHYGVKGMKWGKRKSYQTAYTNENGRNKFITTPDGKVIPLPTSRQTRVTGKGKGLYRSPEGYYWNGQAAVPLPPKPISGKNKNGVSGNTKNKNLKLLRDDSKKGGQASWDKMQRRKENRKSAIEYYKSNIRENQEAIRENGNDPAYARNTAFNRAREQVNQRKLANVVNATARNASGYSSLSTSTKKKKSTGKVKAVVK